jgi:hypothetical protein
LQFNDLRSDHIFLYNWQNRNFPFKSRQFLRTKSANIWQQLCYNSLKKFIGIFLLFFRVFSRKTDKSEAKEPKLKQKDLAVPKMI